MQPSLSELLAQQSALDRAIREARTADKAAAVARVQQLMSEHGLAVADLAAKATSWRHTASELVKSMKICAPHLTNRASNYPLTISSDQAPRTPSHLRS